MTRNKYDVELMTCVMMLFETLDCLEVTTFDPSHYKKVVYKNWSEYFDGYDLDAKDSLLIAR